MKLRQLVLNFSLLVFFESLFGQINQTERLFIPFLDKESQGNVTVRVSDLFGGGESCPIEYTNVVSNTNLFSFQERSLLADIFIKYKHVTTNAGPPGTQFAGRYKTNLVIKVKDRSEKLEEWIARFQYSNSPTYEDLMIGRGISAKFRTPSNNGYNVSIVRGGSGSGLRFMEVKGGLINGVLAEFDDTYAQSTNWDFRLANFVDGRLVEYRQYTNGLVFGKFLMWNEVSGNLTLEAEFKTPYDFQKHRTDRQVTANQ
jgi:hypothetical protein